MKVSNYLNYGMETYYVWTDGKIDMVKRSFRTHFYSVCWYSMLEVSVYIYIQSTYVEHLEAFRDVCKTIMLPMLPFLFSVTVTL